MSSMCTTLEGRYVYVSGRCKEVLGYQPDEIMRLSSDDVEQLIHPDDRARAHAHYARQATLREDEITEATYRIGRTNGEYRLLHCKNCCREISLGRPGAFSESLPTSPSKRGGKANYTV
jgi:PAS domain S-box-containing protein